MCCTQLKLWPIRVLLTFFITNQKARSGAVCVSLYWFWVQILCSSSNTWFANNEINTYYPASGLKIKYRSIPKILRFVGCNLSKSKANFCKGDKQQRKCSGLRSYANRTGASLTFLSFGIQKWFSSQNRSEFNKEFKSGLIGAMPCWGLFNWLRIKCSVLLYHTDFRLLGSQ